MSYEQLYRRPTHAESGGLQGSQADSQRGVLHLRPPHLPGLLLGPDHETGGESRRPQNGRAGNCTGCMYVANTSYYTTPWVVPWMHTQLFAAGAGAVGIAAAYKALMRKGKMKDEPINVISICGDGGGSDAGLAGISSAMHARRVQPAGADVRQRNVRQHRHPGFRLDAVGRAHLVQHAGQGKAHHASLLEEEHGRADRRRPSHSQIRGHRLDFVLACRR